MRRVQYLVRINRDPSSDWGASVPDLPGCVATGKTIDSALRRIARAIEIHVRGLREDGLAVPRPSHRTVTLVGGRDRSTSTPQSKWPHDRRWAGS